jgi:hypothetical protein
MKLALSRTRIGCLLMVLAAAIPVLAQNPAAPTDSRTFQMTPRFTKGQAFRYQTQQSLTMKFKQGETTRGFTAGVDTTLRYKVQETRDSTTGLSALFDGGKLVKVDGDVQLIPKEQDNYPRVMSLDKLGKMLSLKDSGKSARKDTQLDAFFSDVNLLVQLHFLPMPDHAVKIGDSWSATSPLPGAKPGDRKDAEKKDGDKPEGVNLDDKNSVKATLTLLGTDKIGNQETLKVKHSLIIPYEALTDAEGKPVTDPKRAAGKIQTMLIYIQVAHITPDTGLVLRSEGHIEGGIKFEGAMAKLMKEQALTDTMLIGGEFLTMRLSDEASK